MKAGLLLVLIFGSIWAFEAGSILVLLYLLPMLIACGRDHHNEAGICALNVLLGWTLIGWVAALVWSLTSPPPSPDKTAPRRTGVMPGR